MADAENPRAYTQRMEKLFHDTAAELRRDVGGVHDPRARALFETAAEVLGGLERAFHDYDKKSELAWS
ncbi:MAG TPA: hypothetical protein VHS81_13215 [Caulobacteraceae bacterium]|jgi:hypothetical protein|nr:hypothetical protein [Caulobacteraceae bacterium]